MAAGLLRHPVPSCAILCRAMPCHAVPPASNGMEGSRAGSRSIPGLWQPVGHHHQSQPRSCPQQQGQRWSWRAGAGLVPWLECGCWRGPRSPRPLQLCLSPAPAAFSFLRFPLQLPLRAASCSSSCRWPSPAQPRRGHPTVLGWGGAHPGPAAPLPPGSRWCPPMGSQREDGSPADVPVTGREQRCRGRGAAVSRSPGLGVPRAPRVCRAGEGGRARAPSPGSPCPLGWGSRSSPSRLTRGFLRPGLCRDPRPAWLCPGPRARPGGCRGCASFPTAECSPRQGIPIPAVRTGAAGPAKPGPHPHPRRKSLAGSQGATNTRPAFGLQFGSKHSPEPSSHQFAPAAQPRASTGWGGPEGTEGTAGAAGD